MKQFRIPRKTKKILKKTFWLYPPDSYGNSLMANPTKTQEDYSALKSGILRSLPDKRNFHTRQQEMRKKLDQEIFVPDDMLKEYVNKLIRADLRTSSFDILIAAKTRKQSVIAYYNFINASQLYEAGHSSFGNIACLAIDLAKKLLKEKGK
jgi:hypothetical protein